MNSNTALIEYPIFTLPILEKYYVHWRDIQCNQRSGHKCETCNVILDIVKGGAGILLHSVLNTIVRYIQGTDTAAMFMGEYSEDQFNQIILSAEEMDPNMTAQEHIACMCATLFPGLNIYEHCQKDVAFDIDFELGYMVPLLEQNTQVQALAYLYNRSLSYNTFAHKRGSTKCAYIVNVFVLVCMYLHAHIAFDPQCVWQLLSEHASKVFFKLLDSPHGHLSLANIFDCADESVKEDNQHVPFETIRCKSIKTDKVGT